jgi:hypothetical protein
MMQPANIEKTASVMQFSIQIYANGFTSPSPLQWSCQIVKPQETRTRKIQQLSNALEFHSSVDCGVTLQENIS